MIITFLVGFLVALIGQIGGDAMSVISFVVSEDNIGPNGENILVDSIGADSKKYIDKCVNGDGKIEEVIGLQTNQINSFNQIYTAENTIVQAKLSFQQLQAHPPTYENTKAKLVDIDNSKLNPQFVQMSGTNSISFETFLNSMNNVIQTGGGSSYNQERWLFDSTSDKTCPAGSSQISPGDNEFNPLKCKPKDRDWISSTTVTDIRNYADMVTKMIEQSLSFLGLLNTIKTKYDNLLTQYVITLDKFEEAIQKITGQLKKYTGNNNGLFSFIKCTFIGTNLKIILKYLKSSLGGDVKTVGICLLVVGCSLVLSISATILMIVIINIDIENNKKKPQQQIPEYSIGSKGKIFQ